MSAATDYLEDALLNHILRNVAYTSPTTVYAALFTTATTEAGGGTEVAGGGYARQAVTFAVPTGGSTSNSAPVTFGPATAAWGTVTHFAIMDAVSGGNMLIHNALTTPKTIGVGDTATFATGNLTVTCD